MAFLKRPKPFEDVPRFGNLSKDEMQRVVEAGRSVHVPKGWSLLNESTPPDQAYIVIDGTLEVRHRGKKCAELGRGDIVGEIAITAHGLRTGTVTALEPLEMLNLPHDAFQELYDDIPSSREGVNRTVEEGVAEPAGDDAD